MRFQPITGHLLAAASDKVVSIFDVENDRQTHSFQVSAFTIDIFCWASELCIAILHESMNCSLVLSLVTLYLLS